MKLKFELKGLNKQTLPKSKEHIAVIMLQSKGLFVPDWLKHNLTFAKKEDIVKPVNFLHPNEDPYWTKYELKKL